MHKPAARLPLAPAGGKPQMTLRELGITVADNVTLSAEPLDAAILSTEQHRAGDLYRLADGTLILSGPAYTLAYEDETDMLAGQPQGLD